MSKADQKSQSAINDGLLAFIRSSPTPFHAARSIAKILGDAGFTALEQADAWKLDKGGRYYVVQNDSAVVAFRLTDGDPVHDGFRMVGGHTDSPCLKLKPSPEIECCSYLKLGVEVYGGVLLSTWFDRDLSLAGRVTYAAKDGRARSALVDFERPVVNIPSLAIHLNRDVNEGRSINKQYELPPLLLQLGDKAPASDRDFKEIVLAELKRGGAADAVRVLEMELSLYDTQPPAVTGLRGDFINSARLDNLLSCYVGVMSLLEAGPGATSVLVCNDHEEVGSDTAAGASGPFLRSVLERITGSPEGLARAIAHSLFISTDNAHGIHPNYAEKHDQNHGPLLNHGPVLKINANQRYATTSETGSLFALLCEKSDVPFQRFVARADMGCGSTIGPITSTVLGVATVDVGVPTFAMHSVRETAGAKDPHYLYRALSTFFREECLRHCEAPKEPKQSR